MPEINAGDTAWILTSAALVSKLRSVCHQRRRTSSLVQASKTAWAGALNVRSMRRILDSVMRGAVGVAGGA